MVQLQLCSWGPEGGGSAGLRESLHLRLENPLASHAVLFPDPTPLDLSCWSDLLV